LIVAHYSEAVYLTTVPGGTGRENPDYGAGLDIGNMIHYIMVL